MNRGSGNMENCQEWGERMLLALDSTVIANDLLMSQFRSFSAFLAPSLLRQPHNKELFVCKLNCRKAPTIIFTPLWPASGRLCLVLAIFFFFFFHPNRFSFLISSALGAEREKRKCLWLTFVFALCFIDTYTFAWIGGCLFGARNWKLSMNVNDTHSPCLSVSSLLLRRGIKC